MGKGRIEAFSDGVIAIIITIMVLELEVPHHVDLHSLLPLLPVFLSYVLSFIMIGIYWNNHHHMFHVVHHVRGGVLWANLHLLFWLSLMPFTTAWMGENHIESLPVALYGFVLMMSGVAYYILARSLIALEGQDSALAIAFGQDRKGKISVLIYAAAIVLAFVSPWIAIACYVVVALIWLVPDRRVEKVLLAAPAHGNTPGPNAPHP
ncbi:TMEM175 family protein [Kaistia sp. 32K]|uniref:TMEM175 family protein n=1 Tax=Kaistia sp. 32K TaxID=2795690 RepID=UPI0019153E37|nr:TMEM175 family protein [Kaistia sp. 32K]